MGHPAVRDADLVDDRPGLRGEPRGLGQHGIGDRSRERLRAGVGEFLGVQRVAVCGANHRRHPVRAGGVGRDKAGYKFGDLAVGQAPQPEPGHLRPTLQLGEPLPDAADQLLVTEGADQHDRLVTQPDRQEGEQLAGGVVGPVQILQHEHDR